MAQIYAKWPNSKHNGPNSIRMAQILPENSNSGLGLIVALKFICNVTVWLLMLLPLNVLVRCSPYTLLLQCLVVSVPLFYNEPYLMRANGDKPVAQSSILLWFDSAPDHQGFCMDLPNPPDWRCCVISMPVWGNRLLIWFDLIWLSPPIPRFRPDLGHFAWIWAIMLGLGPFCLLPRK